MSLFHPTSPQGNSHGGVKRMPLTPEEIEYRKQGVLPPHMSDITWRIFRIMAEFVEGFQFLSTLDREVTIFGSARFSPDNRWYLEAEQLGKLLAKQKFTTVTGGGPGIMEAANKGAFNAGGNSVGLNIQLPHEQRINPYVRVSRAFYYFFTRKVILAASAQAYIFFPGGFGTQDELFEILTLIQTGKSEPVPIILMGKEYWGAWMRFLEDVLFEKYHTIEKNELDLFSIVDTAEEAMAIIKNSKERSFF
jgi:hypothetical protein